MRKLGFTLAEVLITLVIIGVIAAMTVPTLMQNTNAEEFRSGLKKAISATNQALTLNYALEGLTAQDYTTAEDLVENIFKARMAVVSDSNAVAAFPGTDPGCGAIFTTNDGMVYCVTTDYNSANSDDEGSACDAYQTAPCGSTDAPQLWVDVNGQKKPNKPTTSSLRPRDQYQAQIYSQKIIPYGQPTQQVMFGAGTDKKASAVS